MCILLDPKVPFAMLQEHVPSSLKSVTQAGRELLRQIFSESLLLAVTASLSRLCLSDLCVQGALDGVRTT